MRRTALANTRQSLLIKQPILLAALSFKPFELLHDELSNILSFDGAHTTGLD